MSSGILDSSVLIDVLRSHPPAVAFLGKVAAGGAPATHVMAAAEVLAGTRDKKEQAVVESFLTSFQVLSPSEADGLSALEWYKQFRLSHGVDWPDTLIAATALRLGLDVYTLNVKHFSAFPKLGVIRPY